ncbi:glycosyltransferase family 4 protein [Bradyrhizobium sp. LHD-71]|uniref:MraY family glycosyltransferase n=1 Tax=Bradyrhizobium sp. LHD-71 TaxID=3072141 RepID=UPI00280F3E9E|nr:glycosyltransferase family 4 protein [Bradyrhizobium sp. LHD-71]MDQ8728371.1 glycosyltransferase family 4 protein [Bradyrhizobium sp. LHD-71]
MHDPTLMTTVAFSLAAFLSAAIIFAMLPLLRRHAMALPQARSSHQVPTPQGAGVGVVIAAITATSFALGIWAPQDIEHIGLVIAATVLIAVVGAIDDLAPARIVPRLLLQLLAVVIALAALPDEARLTPALPLWAERAALALAALWFVNLVNFMDGLDWMTAAEVIPVASTLVLLGTSGHLSVPATILAAALVGAFVGFAPFNRPVAQIFLGDVGSLPTGLLLGWCLLDLAMHGQLLAALLLPMYYVADATVTLLGRMMRGEKFWLAHRSHFYQRATDNGLSVMQVVTRVFLLNLLLALLAVASTAVPATSVQLALAFAGLAAVTLVLRRFARPPT